MRLLPASLGGRLLLGAAAFIAVALVVASVLIGFILRHFVTEQVDQRLDTQIEAVIGALSRDSAGGMQLTTNLDGPPFDNLASGWYWQVIGDGVALRSRSLGSTSLDAPSEPLDWRRNLGGRPAAIDGVDAHGQALHIRVKETTIDGRSITVSAAAPRRSIEGPMRQALFSLVGALGILGVCLIVATLIQVQMGLAPLRRLRDALGQIRGGTLQHVPSDQPTELKSLVTELNGLIDQNAQGLANARRHVSNLAHGLKTPLASLSIELQEAGRDPTGSMKALLDQIELRIRHHLGRARAAAAGTASGVRTVIGPRLQDIAVAMARIHQDRAVHFSADVADTFAVACESQDLDEMLGNLLDNAFKWARSVVRVSAEVRDSNVLITIEDDGPGLPDTLLAEALLPGRRLDESVPGHGFGLSITRELAELYGGGVVLTRGPSGGLRVSLALPSAGRQTIGDAEKTALALDRKSVV